eukprot:CAMPEP_0119469098 /NCGR_PEP_ID=MMETSP1344-20130328/2573_1 /TAXON_ID=236787 /ORGANISM="Florenciella parvula, Strain CCMP2471" /LENGTH=116 /DNA_ID=CAMNT_0007501633 /DNA_START=395 /DNA_END=745 /DNA_ORIENTATION=-
MNGMLIVEADALEAAKLRQRARGRHDVGEDQEGRRMLMKDRRTRPIRCDIRCDVRCDIRLAHDKLTVGLLRGADGGPLVQHETQDVHEPARQGHSHGYARGQEDVGCEVGEPRVDA